MNSAPAPAPKDSPQQPKGGKIRTEAPAKHYDDGLGSAGGSLLNGAAAATAAATHAPSSPNAATGNNSLGGMGLPPSGCLSRTTTVRSVNASVAGGRTTSLGRGPAPANTQTHRRSSLQHDKLMGGGLINQGMTASTMQESFLSRSDSVGSKASGTGLPASSGRVAGNNLMSIIESPLPSRTQSRDISATLEVVKAPASLTSPTVPTLYLPRASIPSSPPPPPVPSKPVDWRVSLDGAAPSGPKFVLPSELPKPSRVSRG
ncbi:hypothetical protein FRC00_006240 [Tulasnella sp. 408]|nr:hypothetical protein FRC00_006240 [Tulasnella sp. 408]